MAGPLLDTHGHLVDGDGAETQALVERRTDRRKQRRQQRSLATLSVEQPLDQL
jgi:hypothetical protein